MKKISLKNDYGTGAYEDIINVIVKNNWSRKDTYGYDFYSKEAVKKIKEKIEAKYSDVYFVSTGTQANLVVVASVLRPYESVIAVNTAHIVTSETGAIESIGHKIEQVNSDDGKITIENIQEVLNKNIDEFSPRPKMVYISNTTELGTVYTKKELLELSIFCKKNGLLLYLDGARLGYALTSKKNDMELKDISKMVDIFYIGGNKNGALFGEAIVVNNNEVKKYFKYNLKQRGALFSKSWILGVQFLELFKDNLYFKIAKKGNVMAEFLIKELLKINSKFFVEPESNQIFLIINKKVFKEIYQRYDFYVIKELNDKEIVIRLVIDWSVKKQDIEKFSNDLKKLIRVGILNYNKINNV